MIIHVLVRRDTSRDPRDAGAYNDAVVGHSGDGPGLAAIAADLTERAVRSATRYGEAWTRETQKFWSELPVREDRSSANPDFVALGHRLGDEARAAAEQDTAAIQAVDPAYRALMDVTYHALAKDVGPAIGTERRTDWRDIAISDVDVGTRTVNCLAAAGLTTLGAVDDLDDHALIRVPGVGARGLRRLRSVIASMADGRGVRVTSSHQGQDGQITHP